MPNSESTTRREVNRGRLLIVLAEALWSMSGFFVKSPVFDSWPEMEGQLPLRGMLLAFWRAVFAALAVLPFVRRPCLRWSLVPMSLTFLLMNVTYLPAVTLTTAANAIWLQNTAPIWVFLFGAFVLHDPIVRRDWLLLLFGMLGVAVILFFELQAIPEAGSTSLTGVVLGLLGGVFYAGIVLTLRALRGENSAFLITLCHLVTAVALLPIVVMWGIWPSGIQWWYLAGFGVLQMGLPYLLFAQGIRKVAGHEASAIVLLEPMLVPLWVWLAYHASPTYDRPAWWTFVGAGLILIGLSVRYWKFGRAPSAH